MFLCPKNHGDLTNLIVLYWPHKHKRLHDEIGREKKTSKCESRLFFLVLFPIWSM